MLQILKILWISKNISISLYTVSMSKLKNCVNEHLFCFRHCTNLNINTRHQHRSAMNEWMKGLDNIWPLHRHCTVSLFEVFLHNFIHLVQTLQQPHQIPHTGGISPKSPSLCPGSTTPRSPAARPGHEAPAPGDHAGHRLLGSRPRQESGGHRPSPVRHQSSLHKKHPPGGCCG